MLLEANHILYVEILSGTGTYYMVFEKPGGMVKSDFYCTEGNYCSTQTFVGVSACSKCVSAEVTRIIVTLYNSGVQDSRMYYVLRSPTLRTKTVSPVRSTSGYNMFGRSQFSRPANPLLAHTAPSIYLYRRIFVLEARVPPQSPFEATVKYRCKAAIRIYQVFDHIG